MTVHRCALHDVNELPEDGQIFLVCYECWHIYVTKEDLVREEEKLTGRPATDIFSCPLCGHDL